jgi:hypothetical protein
LRQQDSVTFERLGAASVVNAVRRTRNSASSGELGKNVKRAVKKSVNKNVNKIVNKNVSSREILREQKRVKAQVIHLASFGQCKLRRRLRCDHWNLTK